MSGAIAMGTNKITGLGDPTNAQDAATKIYVDNSIQGLDAKASCRAGTTGNITLSGTQTIDGVAVIAGDRVLVKDQNTTSENGIYVASASTWSRSADADTWDELVHAFVFVEQGTANANNGFVCTISAGGTLGSTAVTWVQFSGAGQVTAGAGLTKTGNTLNVGTASSSRIVVSSDDIDLATTGVTASTYKSVTVDGYGRVTAGTNPTTISGFGITDAYTKTEIDTTVSGLLAKTGGTMSGAIAMGTNKITGMGDPTNAQDAATKNYIDVLFGSTTSAAASAAAAALSASNALTSENNASSSASAASGSATAAAGSATAAAASYDSFDDRYLGAKSSPPSLDNDGNALITGALYFDTTANEMRVWTGTLWKATGSAVNGTAERVVYTATAAQTTFAVIYDAGYVDVYLNGVKQVQAVDFTATSGTDIVFAVGLTAGDIVDIVAYGAFVLADVYTKVQSDARYLQLAGGTMTGAITFAAGQVFPGAGDVTLDGAETLTNKTIAFGSNTLTGVQPTLVSGTSIKTVNSTTLLGSGDLAVQPTLVSGTNLKTVNSTTLLGSGDLAVQPTLVSGTNIKTVNSTTLLGSGDLAVQPTLVSGTNIKTINGGSVLGSGDIAVSAGAFIALGTTGGF
jgi:hypothetical protein